jgi:hypothetical protein
MLVRILLISVLVAVVTFLTFPYWASCSLKYETCLAICDVRHFNADIDKAACKGGCTTKKIACLTEQVLEPSSSRK